MMQPHVEILYFDGCPNHEPTRAMVGRIAAQLRLQPEIELVKVPDAAAALRLRLSCGQGFITHDIRAMFPAWKTTA